MPRASRAPGSAQVPAEHSLPPSAAMWASVTFISEIGTQRCVERFKKTTHNQASKCCLPISPDQVNQWRGWGSEHPLRG